MKRLNLPGPVSRKSFRVALGSLARKCVGSSSLVVLLGVASVAPAKADVHRLTVEEMSLFKRVSSNSGQERATVKLDPILCIVARKRAADMASRNYFSHTNQSGQGPNYLVRRAGFVLPSYYDQSRAGNNIESIGMAVSGPGEVFSQWLKSPAHRCHVLGEVDFYRQQKSVGVGVYRSLKAPYYKYIVFLSAPPNAAPAPRIATLQNPKGVTIARTRPLSLIN